MIQRGWHKPSDRHKYHYFVGGQSECLQYRYEGPFDDVHPTWLDFDEDGVEVDITPDPLFCVKCQWYEAFGKCRPDQKYLKCDYCGKFGARFDRHEWNWAREDVDEVCLCRRCGTWSDNSE